MNYVQPIKEGWIAIDRKSRVHPSTMVHPWLLTTSEWGVVEAICAGCDTNGHVANRLSISPQTVQRHMTNIFNKINVFTKTGLVLAVINDESARRRCFPQLC